MHWHTKNSHTLFRLPLLIKQMNLHHLFPLCKECHILQQEKMFHALGIVVIDSLTVFSEDEEI